MSFSRFKALWFLFGGILISLALFSVMNLLISGQAAKQTASSSGQIIGMIRVQDEEQVRTKQRVRPKKPPPPKEPPPPPKLQVQREQKPERQPMRVAMPNIDIPAAGGGPYLGQWNPGDAAAEGEAVPIVRIDPQWPREALEQGIEGFVQLEVLIDADGSIKNVKVLDSKPGSMFVRNAIRAVQRWKFKPKIEAGVAVERWATTTIEFELED